MTENELPYGDVPGQTHWDGCWRARGHHNCAVREIERLRSAPPAGVVVWVAMQPDATPVDTPCPRLYMAAPEPDAEFGCYWRGTALPPEIAGLLGLAPGECARVRITREET